MMTDVATPADTTALAPLQMLRAEVNVREFQRWAGMRRLQDTDHAMHCLLREAFGELAPKPFRLIIPRGGGRGCLYGYGPAAAGDLQDAANTFADPQQLRALPPFHIDSKPMPLEWQSGKRLGFELRVRPVLRKCGRSARPGAEQDVFQCQAETYPKREMPHSREEVYAGWLSGKLDGSQGVSLELSQTKLVSFQRTRSFRKLHARCVEGPDAVMRGVLTITDPHAFAQLLARGVGRHRAYGYGMLLLRPPGKPIGP